MKLRNFYDELKRRNIIRVATAYAIAGWLIIQICTSTFPYLNLPGWLITAVIIFVLIGFPLALIFAWAFEMTPEGLKKTHQVKKEESISHTTGKKLNGFIIGILSVAVVFLLVERVFFAESTILDNRDAKFESASIAVLPFVNMSSDEENEYFSDGLSEELLNALAKVEDMKVAGRTSSFKFKGQNENITEIGKELGVGHILEGSVRKDGNKVRITAQLIKVEDGYHVWSETYDRELNDIFAVQDEISRAVLNELKVRLLPEDENELESIPTKDVEAYQLYLKANQLVVNRDIDEINIAIELYKNALKLDPTFAEAHARLAIAYNLQAYYGNIPREELIENMKGTMDMAMALNDNLGEAYAAQGLYFELIHEQEKARDAYEKAIDLNPNMVDVYNWLGNLYHDELGDAEKGHEIQLKMYEIDPLAPLSIYNRARVSHHDDNFEEAEEFYNKNLRLNPEFIHTYLGLSFLKSDSEYGRLDEAFILIHKAFKLDRSFSRSLNILVTRSVELDLKPVATYYMEMLHNEFRKSPEYLNRTGLYGAYTGDYTYFEEDGLPSLVQSEIIPDNSGFYFNVTDLAIQKKEPKIALDWFEKFDPGLLSDTLSVLTGDNAHEARALIHLYGYMGEGEKEQHLKDLYCDFVETRNDPEEDEDDSEDYFDPDMARCLILQGQYEELVPYFEEFWVNNKLRTNVVSVFSDPLVQEAFEQNENLRKIRDEVMGDIYEQRANVIDYLKDEGVWQDDWDKQL